MTVKARIRRCGAAAALAALLALAALPQPALAAEPAPDTVVATVNGDRITEADLAQAALDFRDQIAQMPGRQRRGQLIQHLIDTKLSAARRRGGGPRQEARGRSAAWRRCATARCSSNTCAPRCWRQVTDEALHKRYDELVKSFVPTDQYQAAHILVKTEDEAKAIIAELDKGGDFAAIAKEKSLDPGSAAKGGDLGFFDPAQMVKPFDDAVRAEGRHLHREAGAVAVRLARHQARRRSARSRRRPSSQVAQQIRQQDDRASCSPQAMQDLRAKRQDRDHPAGAGARQRPAGT